MLVPETVADEATLRIWNDARNEGNPLDAEPFGVLAERWRGTGTRTHVLGRFGTEVLAAGSAVRRRARLSAAIDVTRRSHSVPAPWLDGIASSLERWAFDAGATALETYAYDTDSDMLAFWAARGWRETGRRPVVACLTSAARAVEVRPPAGVTMTTLAARPDLVRAVHETYRESWTDAPWGRASDVLPFEQWRRNIEQWPGSSPDQFVLAVSGDDLLGYAELDFGAMNDRTVAWHGYTGVRPAHQGAGIGTALKARALDWARERGVRTLLAANDEENTSMRGINARLGYRPEFAYVSLALDAG